MAAPMTLTIQNVKVVGLALAIPTVLITIIRLGARVRARNLGLDDAFAVSSLVGLSVIYVATFLHLDLHLLSHYSVTMRYMVYYIIALGFYSAVWSARLSLLFMVIRITPPYHAGTLRALHFLAWGFGVAWGILIAQTIWVCEKKTTWKMTPAPQCPLGVSVPIAQLISDILADSILIMAPLRLIWRLNDKNCLEHRRLRLVFSASIVMTTTSLIHAYYIMRVGGLDSLFVALIEVCASLLVCSLAIIVSLACRILSCGRSRSYANSTWVDFALDLRSESDAFQLSQGTESLAETENGTVIPVELDAHPERRNGR